MSSKPLGRQFQVSLGGTDAGGVLQVQGSVVVKRKSIFGVEVGGIASAIHDPGARGLSTAAGSDTHYIVLPFVGLIVGDDRIAFRTHAFGLGGGGPEGPAGAVGWIETSLSHVSPNWRFQAGGSLMGTTGCCDSNYTAQTWQAAVSVYRRLTRWQEHGLYLGGSAVYMNSRGSSQELHNEIDNGFALLSLSFASE